MKRGACFINTSRAETVDEGALRTAVKEKGIRAALDVFSAEPAGKDGAVEGDLFSLPGVYGTHHIGASTEQAQSAVASETVRIILSYLSTGHVPNVVNRMEKTPARYLVSVHHRNRVGVLASVLHVIKEHGINVDGMENVLFHGGEGACANIQTRRPSHRRHWTRSPRRTRTFFPPRCMKYPDERGDLTAHRPLTTLKRGVEYVEDDRFGNTEGQD